MKIITASILAAMLTANTAMAFDIPSIASLDPKQATLKTCMLQEAQQALTKGTLTKDNIETQAAKIAASCATKSALKNDSATVQLAINVIKGLMN
ncbi:MAG: hypothetical protein IJ529_02845 [Alphaproteobacteria bacterium]|nr:hypothetical protein [Alphaproteobacteria bacterium]